MIVVAAVVANNMENPVKKTRWKAKKNQIAK